jgi:ceramide glucosyltransferase
MIFFWSWVTASLIAVIGCIYLIVGAVLVGRFGRGRFGRGRFPQSRSLGQPTPAVTMLRPLHGDEPGLDENLLTFCRQNYPGPIQVVCGVADPTDAAIAVVQRLHNSLPGRDFDLVINSVQRGRNRKISNLTNMEPSIRHPVVVLADSDIRVHPDYLARVVSELEQPGVGAVTCLYYGDALGGFWSKLLALDINSHFLPNIIVGIALDLTRPCFGSTIALRRETLVAIGGFKKFADYLADDYAIGLAVRAHGDKVSIPPFAVAHMCSQDSAKELWRHELRWARTIRSIDPLGYAGQLFSHPFAWASLAALSAGSQPAIMAALGIAVVSLGCRALLLKQVQQAFGLPRQSYWLVPARELVSFVVFVAGILGRRVSWKAHLYQAMSGGRALAGRETK